MAQETIERVDHFAVWVDYHHISPDAPKYESGASDAAVSLGFARQQLVYFVKYYQSIGCQITRAHVDRFCSHCHGEGKLYIRPKTRRGTTKAVRCPACKGKDSTARVETWIDLPKALYRY